MELRHLRYFCVVAEELNLTRAAEKLFIAQPPLSRQIKQLEEEVGAELFVRLPRGLELTEAGQYFLAKARQLLDKLDAAVDDTRRIAQHGKTVFSIGFVPSVFYDELPLMIRRLRKNSNLEIVLHDLKTREQIEALKSGKIDIGFGRLFIDDPEVEQELLYREPLLAALPASHTLTSQPLAMSTLATMPFISFPATPGPNFSDIILGMFYQRGLSVNVIQQVNDVQTALALVASGMGFTLVPQRARRLQNEGVDYVALQDQSISTAVIASRRKDDSPSPIMRLTSTILSELIGKSHTAKP